VSTHFEVNEGLFARSTLTDVNTACLWLGVRLSASRARVRVCGGACAVVLGGVTDTTHNTTQANVMVEYTFEEAIALLTKNVDNCRANLRTIEKDLDFIKDQITTTEVNIARIFNFDVKQRRAARGM
jgi:hypothetical protein